MSEDDFKTVYSLRKGAFRDNEAKESFTSLIMGHLRTIYKIKVVYEMLQELDSGIEPATKGIEKYFSKDMFRYELLCEIVGEKYLKDKIVEKIGENDYLTASRKAAVVRAIIGAQLGVNATAFESVLNAEKTKGKYTQKITDFLSEVKDRPERFIK